MSDLNEDGFHGPDDCAEHDEPADEDKPDHIAGRTVSIMTDYHDRHHGLSL